MNSKYSLTYIGVITFSLGYIFNLAGIPFVETDFEGTISFVVAVIGVVQAIYGRWRIGDLSILGGRK